MSATPRHRKTLDRAAAEAAARVQAKTPRREPLLSRSAGQKRQARRDKATEIATRSAMLKEVCAYIRSFGWPGTKVRDGADTIARALEQHFAPTVRK